MEKECVYSFGSNQDMYITRILLSLPPFSLVFIRECRSITLYIISTSMHAVVLDPEKERVMVISLLQVPQQ